MVKKKNIRSYSPEQIQEWVLEVGEPKFRASQIHDWLWKKNVASFEEMLNVSKSLREKLEESFVIEKNTGRKYPNQ